MQVFLNLFFVFMKFSEFFCFILNWILFIEILTTLIRKVKFIKSKTNEIKIKTNFMKLAKIKKKNLLCYLNNIK